MHLIIHFDGGRSWHISNYSTNKKAPVRRLFEPEAFPLLKSYTFGWRFLFFLKSVIKGIRNNSVFRNATPTNINPIQFKCSGNGIGSIN